MARIVEGRAACRHLVPGMRLDYAMLVKHYGPAPEGPRRYSPANALARRSALSLAARARSISASERSKLTIHISCRRFTWLTNAFSKKAENHAHAVSLHMMFYNFCRIHKSLRMTPPMAAGVTDHVWSLAEVVAIIDAAESPLAKRGPYKKRTLT